MRVLAFCTSAVVLASSTAHAADLWVSTKGSDTTGDGTPAKPFATIAKADAAAKPGDVVHVQPGTYSGSFTTRKAGASGAPITFRSETRWGAMLDGGSDTGTSVWNALGDFVDIVGFDVTGKERIGILVQASNVRTIHNHVHDMPTPTGCSGSGGAGIDDGDYSAHDDDMIANVVHDIGPATGSCFTVQGLYHSNLRGKIVNNLVYRVSGFGIHTWHNPKDVTIGYNLVFGARAAGIIVGAGDAPGTGVASGFVVANNILVDNAYGGVEELGAVGANTYASNLFWKNAGPDYKNLTTNKGIDSIDADPLFVKWDATGAGDEHLQKGSPAIDVASSLITVDTDLDDFPRPVGKANDLGPYEWHDETADAGADASEGGVLDAASDGSDGSTREDSSAIGDAATDAATDAPTNAGATTNDAGGCGCRTTASSTRAPWALLAVALAVASRRRGRRDVATREPRRSSSRRADVS